MKRLHRKIMRGIYYAYALRLVSQRGVWQGFVMLSALIGLTQFVSLSNVLHNLRGVELKGIPQFTYNAVSTTEAWTFLCIGLIVFCALSIRVSMAPRQVYTLQRGV